MANYNQANNGSGNAKKIISIAIVILLVVGLSVFLFKISPEQSQTAEKQGAYTSSDFDLSGIATTSEPSAVTSGDNILGNAGAKNTMIVYSDFQCPSCAIMDKILVQVPSAFTDTKLVFRDFPLYQIHDNAIVSAYAAEAAAAQGKFWEFGSLLFENQSAWENLSDPVEYFVTLAKQAGVADTAKFQSDITNKTYKSKIQKDLVEAFSLNLPGTPTIFFNGHKLDNDTLDNLKKQAENYLVK